MVDSKVHMGVYLGQFKKAIWRNAFMQGSPPYRESNCLFWVHRVMAKIWYDKISATFVSGVSQALKGKSDWLTVKPSYRVAWTRLISFFFHQGRLSWRCLLRPPAQQLLRLNSKTWETSSIHNANMTRLLSVTGMTGFIHKCELLDICSREFGQADR